MRCLNSRSTLFPFPSSPRLLLQAARGLLLGALALGGVHSAPAQAPAKAPLAPAAPAASTTPGGAFLGDVASSSTASGLNPDEARRLFFKPGGAAAVTPPREINLPPSAERRRLSQLREALVPAPAAEATVRILALEGFLDYDQEDQIIYSPGRTRIRYGAYFLEADKMIFDARLQEVQAEGNVVILVGQDRLSADSIRYNFKNEEGVAFNVSGEHAPVYFRPALPKSQQRPDMPQFQKVSRQESIFRDTNVTTCDFKVPHYNLRGREVVLFQGDRIFIRGATFQVWGVPLLYLPTYTRSLTGGSPWFTRVGYNSRAGVYARLGYAYEHQTQEPGFENESEYVTRSAGKAEAYVDYLSKIGPGLGFDYRYQFEYNKHRGELSLYQIYDQGRDVVPASPDFSEIRNSAGAVTGHTIVSPDTISENERWRYLWKHRTQITENLNATVNIDMFSDPDIFYDIIDLFGDDNVERERRIQRRGRVALTDVEESFVARLMFEIKDRVGINRINNFSNPIDDNLDFNLNPYTSLGDADVDGISARRWGRVTERMPQFDLATRYLPIGNRPLYYMSELNLYNNLDKGLNIVNTNDDAWVQGAQFYNRLMRQWKLSERYTLLGKVGVGAGTARREGEDLGIGDFSDQTPLFGTIRNQYWVDGLWSGLQFDNDGDFFIGRRRYNFNQIRENYLWGDAEMRLNARFSDALTGVLDWRARATTSNYIGDWYASMGDQTFREDLFNYPVREHWLEGGLNYRLARPLLTLYTRGGINLIPKSDLFSKEDVAVWTNGFNWSNQRQTLVWSGFAGIRRQQLYDPTDINEYQENRLDAGSMLSYSPVHQRWYTQVRVRYDQPLNEEITTTDEARNLTFFTETETDTDVKLVYGRELGPKYNTEFRVRWDEQVGGLRDVSWLLQRDLHDAVAVLRIRLQNNDRKADSRDDSENQMDVRLGLKFKLPGRAVNYGAGDVKTLRDRVRQPAVAY